MRNQPIYILTEDLNFFYMLKSELDKHKIKFQILNLDAKIPAISSIILTTFEDINKTGKRTQDNYLVYSKKRDFNRFLIKVVAAFRVGFKKYYSKLTFSIDPGNKLGLMIFLDDYYLDSYCCFEKIELLKMIKKYVVTFQEDNPKTIYLDFKLGRGVLTITYDLVKQIYRIFQSRKNLKVFLIDEFRSSKIRFSGKKTGRKFSKDEISALILAFRNGIAIDQDNYENIFTQITNKKLNTCNSNTLKTKNHEKSLSDLKEMVKKALDGEFTLSSAIKMLNNTTL